MKIATSDIRDPGVAKKEGFDRLKESIKKMGLMHPIMLQANDGPFRVIVGKQRFMALKELGFLEIEVSGILPSDATNAHEISLHENLRRENLAWHEQVLLEKELHDMRVDEHGSKRMGRDWDNNPGWTKEMTAKELGISYGGLSQDLKLAEALLINPELKNVQDKTTALRLIKLAENRMYSELEALRPATMEMNQVLHGDSAEILKHFPAETFDLCLTDPPWSQWKEGGVQQESLLPVFKELMRVLKSTSIMYVITSTTDFYFYQRELERIGFQIQEYPLIWHKPKNLTRGRLNWQTARDYEPILLASKGKATLTAGVEFSSVLTYDNVHVSRLKHPHEKPVDLMKDLISRACYPGSKVIDPFAGSGVTGEACKAIDRRYILIEKDYPYYEQIKSRFL
jgi:16S rRNA G966 N2-methylase RsmD